MPEPKNFFIKTFGCQMNVYDSDKMKDIFLANNIQPTEDSFNADYIVLNTCHIREKACLLYTSPSPRDRTRSRMPSSA